MASTSEDEEEQQFEIVQISTKLYKSFGVYPKHLRDIVENNYTDQIYTILDALKSDQPLTFGATYHIQRGARFDDGTSVYRLRGKDNFRNASMANVEALEKFINKAPAKSHFIRTADVKLANPQYTRLQSVPPEHMGWGFDKFGCVSLRLTTIEGEKLKHEYIFVERREVEVVKVEDEECQIVEAPNAEKE